MQVCVIQKEGLDRVHSALVISSPSYVRGLAYDALLTCTSAASCLGRWVLQLAAHWTVGLRVITQLTPSPRTGHLWRTPRGGRSLRRGDHKAGGLGSCERRGSQDVEQFMCTDTFLEKSWKKFW